MNNTLKTLIVDDEAELRLGIIAVLKNLNLEVDFQIDEMSNGQEAVQACHKKEYDLIFMDVKMPELDGLSALKIIKDRSPASMIVILTAHSNLNDAILAIKDGAYDYIEKPLQNQKLIEIVKKSIEARKLVQSLTLSKPIFDDDIESDFVGSSFKMKEIFNLINRLSKVETTVLIRGENGTGKELVARAIHHNSNKKDGPFVAINCGAIPENLMESELFGHEKGAFTGAIERKIGKFQLASSGTLFLDEIGELKPELQVKLLRVLQEKTFIPVGSAREIKTSARIVAATNRNLEKMMEENLFREDLFYRLNVLPIFLPPLRERKDDIPALVRHFIGLFSKQHNSSINDIEPVALNALLNHKWPGNIRELENCIERAFIIENSKVIQISSLPESIVPKTNPNLIQEQQPNSNLTLEASNELDFESFKEQAEKDFILAALKANKGKINQTVAQANIPKNTLLRKMRKYGISADEFKS
jgi:two-component system response regulator AtoC